MTSIKGHNTVINLRTVTRKNPNLDLVNNTVINLRTLTRKNPNLDLVNINPYVMFCQISSIYSQDIERKRNSVINQGP